MKKKILVLMVLMSTLLPAVIILAEPNWDPFGLWPWVSFKITGSGIHIAKDPMFDPGSMPVYMTWPADPQGWVIFPCSTDRPDQKNAPKGFDYSVTGKGLTPGGSYDVKAYPQATSDDWGASAYSLGTMIADGNGEGEISGFIDLPAGDYGWDIKIESSGTVILMTHLLDPPHFGVIS